MEGGDKRGEVFFFLAAANGDGGFVVVFHKLQRIVGWELLGGVLSDYGVCWYAHDLVAILYRMIGANY